MLRTQDLGLKGWYYHSDFTSFPFQERDGLKVSAVPAVVIWIPSETSIFKYSLVWEGVTIYAKAGKRKVEDHFVHTLNKKSLPTVLDNYLFFRTSCRITWTPYNLNTSEGLGHFIRTNLGICASHGHL